MRLICALRVVITALGLTAAVLAPSLASAELCNASERFCGLFGGTGSSSGGAPTRGSKVRINPSAVPIEEGLGIELLYFDRSLDFALVKGLGRIGAAISPSNSEGTFFGPPAIETEPDFILRQDGRHKLPAQKYTLATAIGLFANKKSGLRRAELNLGVMGKYNTLTQEVLPGGGLTGVFGPFTFGYSVYKDQTLLDYTPFGFDEKRVFDAHVETYSIGAYLNSVAIDYSVLREITTVASTVNMITGTLLLKESLLTVSTRTEVSNRPIFNRETGQLEYIDEKRDLFLGGQHLFAKQFMFGLFYNYYRMQDISIGVTVFL